MELFRVALLRHLSQKSSFLVAVLSPSLAALCASTTLVASSRQIPASDDLHIFHTETIVDFVHGSEVENAVFPHRVPIDFRRPVPLRAEAAIFAKHFLCKVSSLWRFESIFHFFHMVQRRNFLHILRDFGICLERGLLSYFLVTFFEFVSNATFVRTFSTTLHNL